MKKDFPAAHSNDTEWFAVDEEGNLALFDACCDGASPIGCSEEMFSESWYELSEQEGILECRWDFSLDEFPEIFEPSVEFLHTTQLSRYEYYFAENADYEGFKYDAYLFLIKNSEILPQIAPGVTVLYFPEINDSDASLVISPVVLEEKMAENVNRLIQEGQIVGIAGDKEEIWNRKIFANLEVFRYEPENGGF